MVSTRFEFQHELTFLILYIFKMANSLCETHLQGIMVVRIHQNKYSVQTKRVLNFGVMALRDIKLRSRLSKNIHLSLDF